MVQKKQALLWELAFFVKKQNSFVTLLVFVV